MFAGWAAMPELTADIASPAVRARRDRGANEALCDFDRAAGRNGPTIASHDLATEGGVGFEFITLIYFVRTDSRIPMRLNGLL